VRDALRTSGLPAGALRLEITESTVMSDPARLQATLAELRGLGVCADIDDFGTGYSSLTFLQHFPGDTLKVDRSFVSAMVHHDGHRDIVRAIVALAHDLGLRTIAEGIDDAAQLALLREIGCEQGQGFLFAEPLPADAVADVLAAWPHDVGAAPAAVAADA
jgi:EAL domain-containing protein (putative c-di-GMP-specific phosphodiesterase class I)